MRIHHGVAHRVSTFVICSFVFLPLGRSAAPRRLPQPPSPAQASSGALHFNPKDTSLRDLMSVQEGYSLYPLLPDPFAVLASNDPEWREMYSPKPIDMTNAQAMRTGPGKVYTGGDFQDKFGEVYKPLLKEYEALHGLPLHPHVKNARPLPDVMAEIIVRDVKAYRNDLGAIAKTVGDAIAPNVEVSSNSTHQPISQPEIRALVTLLIQNIHDGKDEQGAQSSLSALIAGADKKLFSGSSTSSFDSDPNNIARNMKDLLKFGGPRAYPLTVPAAILASNDPEYKGSKKRGLPVGDTEADTLRNALQKEYHLVNNQLTNLEQSNSLSFPAEMTDIIVREAKAYAGDDLEKMKRVVADMIAGSLNEKSPGYSKEPNIPVKAPDGDKLLSKEELRAEVGPMIDEIRSGGGAKAAEDFLRNAIDRVGKKALLASNRAE